MYRDRGIIKWAPFDALTGMNEFLRAMLYQKNQQEMPVLSEDQLLEMNRQCLYALRLKCEVLITYFEDGYFYDVVDLIKKVDTVGQLLILESGQCLKLAIIVSLSCF